MTKVSPELREAILKDKQTMSTKELQGKYNLSRSSIQRVKLPDLESRVGEYLPPAKPNLNQEQEAFVEQFVQEPPPPPTYSPQRKSELIQKILMNADAFPAHFPFITDRTQFGATLSEKIVPQLEELLDTMQKTRSTNNFAAQIKQVFFVGCKATEALGSRIRLKTDGLTNALLQQQQELDYIFKELAITYSDSFQTSSSPELRLAMVFGMAVLQTDAQNRLKEHLAKQETTEETYSDL